MSRTIRVAVALVTLFAAHAWASGDAHAARKSLEGEGCVRTDDCAAPLRCVEDLCVAPAVLGVQGSACQTDAQCMDPLRCRSGVCAGLDLTQTAATPDVRVVQDGWDRRRMGWVGVGMGATGFVVGSVLLVVGVERIVTYNDKLEQVTCTDPPPACGSRDERLVLATEADTAQTVGMVSLVNSALMYGLFATGLGLAIAGFSRDANTAAADDGLTSVQVVPRVTTDGEMGLEATIRF